MKDARWRARYEREVTHPGKGRSGTIGSRKLHGCPICAIKHVSTGWIHLTAKNISISCRRPSNQDLQTRITSQLTSPIPVVLINQWVGNDICNGDIFSVTSASIGCVHTEVLAHPVGIDRDILQVKEIRLEKIGEGVFGAVDLSRISAFAVGKD